MSPDEAEGFTDTGGMSQDLAAEIREGLDAAERGETADLGSFAQYIVRPVTITYDPSVRAAYVYLVPTDEARSVRTQQLDDSTIIDYGADGRIIGVELLDVALPVIASPDPR